MLSNLLVSVPWLAFAVLVAAVIAGPVIGRVLVSRPRTATTLLAIALIAVLGLTLSPEGESDRAIGCAAELPFLAPTAVEPMANILLFVPVALLAGLRWKKPMLAPLCASALSVAIEAVQALVPAIGRACDTGDWVTNTIGAVLGGVLAALALVWHRSATRLEPVPVE